MKLRYITCSDPREHNSVESVMNLAMMPNAEIAVQCHPSKMSPGMPRNVWFEKLLAEAQWSPKINLAMHINAEWANDICAKGTIPPVILNWMNATKGNNLLINRVQLNMPKATADNANIDALAKIIHDFYKTEFIFQYNDKTRDAIKKLHETGVRFSLLFDASGGNGISPQKWEKPIYDVHPMGYSGGLSPDNVMQKLDAISHVVEDHEKIWIDAEGKLKSPIFFSEKPQFDAGLARAYVDRANLWQQKNQKQR